MSVLRHRGRMPEVAFFSSETPRHNAKPTLNTILDDRDRTGFKLTSMLRRLVLAGEETGCWRFRDQGDPFYDATCVFCRTAYEERLGGMLLACTACMPVVTRVFPTTGDWTRTAFATLCRMIVEAGHMALNQSTRDSYTHAAAWYPCSAASASYCGRRSSSPVARNAAKPWRICPIPAVPCPCAYSAGRIVGEEAEIDAAVYDRGAERSGSPRFSMRTHIRIHSP
jgi:hypothetical protein